eukprot:1914382-Alexandrium_andersonii.AAC.1
MLLRLAVGVFWLESRWGLERDNAQPHLRQVRTKIVRDAGARRARSPNVHRAKETRSIARGARELHQNTSRQADRPQTEQAQLVPFGRTSHEGH